MNTTGLSIRMTMPITLVLLALVPFVLSYESIEMKVIEEFNGVQLIQTPKCLKIALSIMSPSTAMSDFRFLTEYGYEQLSRYFFGNNYEHATVPQSTPMFIQLDVLDMAAPRDLSFYIPKEYSKSPPAPRYPLYIKDVEEKFYFVSKINTTDFWSVLHAAGDLLTDLSYERMPVKDSHVYLALYNYPPSLGDETAVKENEIWVERDTTPSAAMSFKQFWRIGPWTLIAFVLFFVQFVNGKQLQSFSSHSYKVGESIAMYASKIGPYDNPSETYRYYELPFCTAPEGPVKVSSSLGEFLEGDRLISTAYSLLFATDLEYQVACEKKLTPIEVQIFREAVTQDYYYQMFFDDLPLWGFIGRAGSAGKALLYAHVHFDVLFNHDKVIGLNVSADVRTMVDVSEDKEVKVKFSYSTKWTPTTLPFERRLDKYSRLSLLPRNKEIHWFSIMNSCVIVLILVGFLATILMRVLKNDCVKYMKDDEVGEEQEESGWKYLHGDVFRFPRPLSLFCAMMGTGTQFLIISTFIFLFAMLDMFYPYNRGTLQSACVVLYALTSGIAGYNAGAWYKILGGSNWARTILLTCVLFLGPLLLLFCFTNSVALAYNSTQALPFSTIVSFILLWALVTFPLTIVGGIMGKNTKDTFQASCRTTKYPREVPPLPWYRQSIAQMTIAGFLPFSAIYIELYYIFVSIWGYKVYIVWSILLIVFVILILVTAFITVALTYFQLAAEDHRWWWRSFLCGGSTGLFVFVYCFYFYFQKSEMYGLLQTSFFFGYMGIVCYALFLMLGSVGFRASLIFVKQIYKAVKCE